MVYRFVFFIVSFLDTSPLFSKALNHHHYTNHMRHIENKHQIPAGLLNAIAKVESGRWSEKEKQLVSWPWVIHAKGEGHYFPTKELAIEAVKNLQAQGIKNIDVGLMQMPLKHWITLLTPSITLSMRLAFWKVESRITTLGKRPLLIITQHPPPIIAPIVKKCFKHGVKSKKRIHVKPCSKKDLRLKILFLSIQNLAKNVESLPRRLTAL